MADPQKLGTGQYRWAIYDRNGVNELFSIDAYSAGSWGRARDDISQSALHIPMSACTNKGIANDLGARLRDLRAMHHNLVIYRQTGSGPWSRVWEGPLWLLRYQNQEVYLEARDVMIWPYRRTILNGYDDSGSNTKFVAERALLLLQAEMARDDPNVLLYAEARVDPDDAREGRALVGGQKTLFAELDDMAANSGLDYVAIGRKLIFWDTSKALGFLSALKDIWVEGGVTVTEYGSELATDSYVSSSAGADANGQGIFGEAHEDDPAIRDYYGRVETLAAPYSESDSGTLDVADPAAVAAYRRTLSTQAGRNRSGRTPAPVMVRLAGNSRMSPDTPIDITQLVPGVWGLLETTTTLRYYKAWQKLDSIGVTVGADGGSESVNVSFTPAPGQGVAEDDLAGSA